MIHSRRSFDRSNPVFTAAQWAQVEAISKASGFDVAAVSVIARDQFNKTYLAIEGTREQRELGGLLSMERWLSKLEQTHCQVNS